MGSPRFPRDPDAPLGWLGCLLALVVGAATWGGLFEIVRYVGWRIGL
jgi:hypothetical protein